MSRSERRWPDARTARRQQPEGGAATALYTRRAATVVVAGGVAALAFFIARPGTTPAITRADGTVVPGSIASLEKVDLGGRDQWLSIRGHSEDSPVLLYLSGGPGQSDMPQTRLLWRDLERNFVVVNWDEPGVGKAYAQIDPTSKITLDRAAAETVALTNYLRKRFDEQKVYLVGESWGTVLGVRVAQRRPDLYHAYIGSGQMVDIRETDRLLYRDMLAYARRTGDDAAADKMRDYGPPPYDDPLANAYVMGYYEELAGEYETPDYAEARYEEDPYGPLGALGREYSLVDKVNHLRSLADYFAVMYPQLQEIDLRRDAKRLQLPVYLVQGRHELEARSALVPAWLEELRAPRKRLYWFEHAGHSTAFEEFKRFGRIMTGTVLPETYPASSQSAGS